VTDDPGGNSPEYPEIDLSVPQFTVRAILTGMTIGAVLSLCNIYAGLKIGWGFNMSVAAALLSYGFWQSLKPLGARDWNKLENNINQTAASSAASISSAGLVAPIPALTILTGKTWSWLELFVWCLSVSIVGVVVAIGLRRQMLIVDKLAFPNGIATAETLDKMYARGTEALKQVKALLLAAVVAGVWKYLIDAKHVLSTLGFGWLFVAIKTKAGGLLAKAGTLALSAKNLTFALSTSPLFIGVGAIIGPRAGVSMLLGAIGSWYILGPIVLENGWVTPGKPDGMWFGPLVKWMLWPGVIMMVTASLTSFGFSWRSVVAALSRLRGKGDAPVESAVNRDEFPAKLFMILIGVVLIISVICQIGFFGIGWGIATFGVLLTFVLAIVAARVSGETGITPVGPMGKVTQLTFGAIDPGNVSANLMAANVTGGAASQCADLLHDMKTGLMIGASPRLQTYAQFLGVLAGAMAGSAAYLVLVQDPVAMMDDPEWAMPAVLQWMAVAEIFAQGLDKLPAGTVPAMIFAGSFGIVLAVLEKLVPKSSLKWIPSPTAVGLAFVIPAYYSISMCIGGLLAWVLGKWVPNWTARFLIVVAAGVIVGESLVGVANAIIAVDWTAFF
jgi:putative OPT family oligopeptide transporter